MDIGVLDIGISAQSLITYSLACFVVMITPGVTVSALISTTLTQGTRAGFLVELGADIARLSMIAILGLGLASLTQFVATFFDVIKMVGALYLVWLGWGLIRNPAKLTAGDAPPQSNAALVVRGIIVLWSNPKALIFLGALVPQFINADYPILPQVLLLGAIWLITVSITDSGYILAVARARSFFAGRSAKIMSQSSGVLLIVAGLWLATSQKA